MTNAVVSVLIAAHNAAATVGAAVASALAEDAVAEVILVDDASTDDTASAARRMDDGSGRLRVLRLPANRGPSAARNQGIEAARAPLLAVLDADDRFLPGRFARLLDGSGLRGGADLVADNIRFVPPGDAGEAPPDSAGEAPLELVDFVRSNISRAGRPRGELGFLKPVMRRAFLDRHGLRYDETLRFGEDYDLYLRAFLAGARFRLVGAVGYLATEHPTSLSADHRTDDLDRLAEAERKILANSRLSPEQRDAVAAHYRHMRARWRLRRCLDDKRMHGRWAAALALLQRPAEIADVAIGVARDKLLARSVAPRPGRLLFQFPLSGR